MSKRLLSALLCFALLISLAVIPTYAREAKEAVTDKDSLCPCGCGQTLEQVTWMPWDANNQSVLATGHYYLDGDYIQDDYKSVISGNKIVLDLRGHTLSTKAYSRLFYIYGYLAVVDTVGGGLFTAKTSGTAMGGIVIVASNETNDPTFELHGGTIMPAPESKGAKRGGLICLTDNATFRMTGGRVMGGTTVTPSGDASPGGNICAYNTSSRIEILGGEVIGGTATSHGGNIYSKGTTILKNCILIGGNTDLSGGNICQVGGSLTAENCTFSHGVSNHASNGGGNISLLGAAASLKGCTLQNGYAVNFGGNLLSTGSSLLVEDTRFASGTASRGGNLYLGSGITDATLKNVEIPGDVSCFTKNLSLEGVVRIGLLSNGMRLGSSSSPVAVDAQKLEAGSEIYVDAIGTYTNGGESYFKGALRTVLNGAEASQAADGEIGGYCPHCGQQVAWTAYDPTGSLVENCLHDSATDTNSACTGNHLESGHYYLTKDLTGQSQKYIGVYLKNVANVAKDVVIDLRSYDITATTKAFYLRPDVDGAKNTLTILDSAGGGVVSGSGTHTYAGGVIYADGGIINIYGGKLQYKMDSTKVVFNGGVIASYGAVNLHGGVLDGSTYYVPETDPETTRTISYRGGAVYLGTNKTLNMTGGAILGGTAWTGGALFTLTSDNIRVTGGHFIGGTSSYGGTDAGGGNIHLYATSSNTGTAQLSNCAITGGTVTAAKGGGNLLAANYTAEIENAYIAFGSTAGYGGNLTASSGGVLNITDSIIYGGHSTANSGNIHIAATNSRLNLVSSLVTAGVAGSSGGNCTLGNGYSNIYGGEISFGTAKTYGGNISANAGNYSATCDQYSRFQKDEKGNVPLICGGNAGTYGGNVYVGGVLYMDAVKLQSGCAKTSGPDLCMINASKQGKLSIGADVTGTIYAVFASTLIGDGGYGQPIDRTECINLNAIILLPAYNNIPLAAKDGQLHLCAASVVSQNNEQWFVDAASATADCPRYDYVKLYSNAALTLQKDLIVDLNGHNLTVDGACTLYGMDSVGGGTATTADTVQLADVFTAPDGMQYVSVTDGVTTFHKVSMGIRDVVLRPASAGLYYTGSWNFDSTLSAMVDSYGIAVSLVATPDVNCLEDSTCMYSSFTDFQNGTACGTLIDGIMKTAEEGRTAEENSACGDMPVYAKAYVKLTDGRVLVSSDNVSYSLHSVMDTMDKLITEEPTCYRRHINAMRAFRDTWADFGMESWEFDKLITPADDGVIDVLMIGNSFCYNYVEELYGLAEAAGIPMRVCNVYYSGCKMYQHYDWWMAGESNYQFYITDGEGRRGVGGKSLEWCLAQGEWDIISLQESSGRVRNNGGAAASLEKDRICYDTLLPYLEAQFPNARTLWHQTWALQLGYTSGDYTLSTEEEQTAYYQTVKEHSQLIADTYGWELVPSGDAWQIIRAGGYDNLCARLGKGENHEGDYHHEGDIGGGQYLNACVWFEVITGQSVVGNPYEPIYTYGSNTYNLKIAATELQAAAHEAVVAFRNAQAS